MRSHPLSPTGRLFAAAAFFEGITWAGLLLGMFLKYGTQTTELGVWLFGRLHGNVVPSHRPAGRARTQPGRALGRVMPAAAAGSARGSVAVPARRCRRRGSLFRHALAGGTCADRCRFQEPCVRR